MNMKKTSLGFNNLELKGISAAPGLAEGPAVFFQEERLQISRHEVDNPDSELARFREALIQAKEEIISVKQSLEAEGATSEAMVFDAHKMFLEDPSLLEMAGHAIRGGLNAEAAWSDAINFFAQAIGSLSDETLSAREADVRDVGRRVLRHLCGLEEPRLVLQEPSIIIARDLTPSQTATLDKSMIIGFCTIEGGPTSHTAILAKALGIPALVGLGESLLQVEPGTHLILDAISGVMIANPESSFLDDFRRRKSQANKIDQQELAEAFRQAVTQDGHPVEVVANVGSLSDADTAIQHGAEGIGLLRTEFLYLERNESPGEDEQVNIYGAIFEVMGKRPVVVRTLDIGGDKEIPYLGLKPEANPFLGWRAIRISLDQPEFFKTQLRALLRASPGYDLRIMFPMIATLQEVRAAKQVFQEARKEIEAEGYPVAESIQIGIMVEIPSVAVLADQFAREVDFFSIGTNDLTQYTFAADRGNERVAYLGDPCHPAVLRQIQHVIEIGHQEGIWIGLCGEMGSDPNGIPLLLGLGLDEFSVSPASIPHVKSIIRRWSMEKAQTLVQSAIHLGSAGEVRELVREVSSQF
jgi:phosphoenolpyruvate-protein phosphotransferase